MWHLQALMRMGEILGAASSRRDRSVLLLMRRGRTVLLRQGDFRALYRR